MRKVHSGSDLTPDIHHYSREFLLFFASTVTYNTYNYNNAFIDTAGICYGYEVMQVQESPNIALAYSMSDFPQVFK